MTIVNYASSVINKLEALLTDDTRVVIYNHHVLIVQATHHLRVQTLNLATAADNGGEKIAKSVCRTKEK